MLQIALLAVSVGLIILGIKGFTPGGLAFSKKTTLRGRSGMIVGTLCIVAGIVMIPAFVLLIWAYSR